MRRLFVTLLIACLPLEAGADVRIVTTLPDLADLARSVGANTYRRNRSPEGFRILTYISAKPSFMRDLNRADLLVYNGLELEVGWLPLLLQGARNPRVVLGAPGHLNASTGITPLEIPRGSVDRSMGDVHPEGNPHYLLDPRNGRLVAGHIAKRLAELDPEHADDYRRNLEELTDGMNASIAGWEKRAASVRGRKLVSYHNLWPYLEAWLGLDIVDEVEDKPGIPPTPRHTSELIARMKAEGIDVIICASYGDVGSARKVAERANARLVVLPAAVGGDEGVDTYTDLFDTIVSARLVDAADR